MGKQDRTKRKEESKSNRKRKFGEIELCTDIKDQPMAFAEYFSDMMFERTKEALTLKWTPELIKELQDVYEQQRKILELGKVDKRALGKTYITI